MRFRGKEETIEVSLDKTYTIIDSAEVCASFPESVYDFVQEYLLSQISRVLFGFIPELMHVRDANLEALLVGAGDLE